MLPPNKKDLKLIGLVRRVEYEFAEFENNKGKSIEVRKRPSGYELFDREGNVLEQVSADRNLIDQVYRDVFTYDENHDLNEHHEFDEDGSLIGKSIFEKTDDGKLIEECFWLDIDNSLKLDSRRIYDRNGIFLESSQFDVNGNEIPRVTYPRTKIVDTWLDEQTYEEQRFDKDGKPDDKRVTKYDKRGNIVEFSVYETKRGLVIRDTYEYEFDEAGNWTVQLHKHWVVGWGDFYMYPSTITRRKIEYYG